METARVMYGHGSPDRCAPRAPSEDVRLAGDPDRPCAGRATGIAEGADQITCPDIAACQQVARQAAQAAS